MPVIRCPAPNCGQTLSLPDAPATTDFRCPHCGQAITPPSATLTAVREEAVLPATAAATVAHVSTPTRMGRFEIRQRLGEGAFGVVYRAYDPQLDREVALKVAKPELLNTETRVKRFLREAKAAANLRHPNIVPVHDSGRDGEQYYIASAFIPGKSLAGVLEEMAAGKGLEMRRASEIVRRLAEALAYAHSKGIVHRDVKPANAMLDDQGEPMLLDFGLAARADGDEKLTQEATMMGTPAYLAPEQAQGKAEAASDQYSLGRTLYELLTGLTPFSGPPEMQIFLHQSQEPPSPRRLAPHLPRDLETICLKCLAKKPAERYPNCRQLADDLRHFLDGEPIQARRQSVAERAWRWTRRNPALAAAGAVVLLLLAAVAVVSTTASIDVGKALKAEKAARDKADEQTRALISEQKRTRRSLYFAQMNLAHNDWRDTQIASMIERLNAQRPAASQENFRGFEWDYLWRLCHSELRTFRGHLVDARSVSISADGSRIVCAGEGGWVWDATTGKVLLTLPEATAPVAISADGTRIVNGSADHTVRLWDGATGKELFTLKGHTEGVTSVAISGDGAFLVSGTGNPIDGIRGEVRVWDGTTGKEVVALEGATGTVAISANGKRIVTAGEEVKLWETATGKEVLTLPGGVAPVALSADGKRIVTVGDDWTLKVWDGVTGHESLSLKGHAQPIASVALSTDGQRIVSASWDQTVKAWDAITGKEVLTLKGHTGSVESVALSADGQRIVSASLDGTVKVWSGAREQEALSLKDNTASVSSVALSADGQRIAGAAFREVKVWDGTLKKAPLTLQGHADWITSVAISADGTRLVSGSHDKTVKVWDGVTGQEKREFQGHTGWVTSVAMSADGTRIVSASFDKTLKVWDGASGQELHTLKGHTIRLSSVAISADGKRIVSASGELDEQQKPQPGEVKVWDAITGKEVLTLKGATIPLAFSADGQRIVSGGDDDTIKIWDAARGQELLSFKKHALGVVSVAFSPDGKRLVIGSLDRMNPGSPGAVKVWDAATGQQALSLIGGGGIVAISADGKRIVGAGGSADHTVKVWDAPAEETADRPRAGPGR